MLCLYQQHVDGKIWKSTIVLFVYFRTLKTRKVYRQLLSQTIGVNEKMNRKVFL